MKARNGFVSNSSISSFIIIYNGVRSETQKLVKEMIEASNDTMESNCKFFISEPQFVCDGLNSTLMPNGDEQPEKKWYTIMITFKDSLWDVHPELGKLFSKFIKNEGLVIEEFAL